MGLHRDDADRRVQTIRAVREERPRARGEVAFRIVGLCEGLTSDALVFTKPDGTRIDSIRTWWNAAVLKVWAPSRPSEARPRFHDLRKTCATRVESVSSHAVAKMLLRHADEDVTDSYVRPEINDVRAAIDRAACLIDGEKVGNVVEFANVTTNVTLASEAV